MRTRSATRRTAAADRPHDRQDAYAGRLRYGTSRERTSTPTMSCPPATSLPCCSSERTGLAADPRRYMRWCVLSSCTPTRAECSTNAVRTSVLPGRPVLRGGRRFRGPLRPAARRTTRPCSPCEAYPQHRHVGDFIDGGRRQDACWLRPPFLQELDPGHDHQYGRLPTLRVTGSTRSSRSP